MPYRILAAFLVACALAFAAPAAAAEPPTRRLQATDQEIAAFFDEYLAARVHEMWIPGAALVVVRDGRVLLQKGYGEADTASGRPVDPEQTLFRAASISKLLPWILAMQLVEQGQLDLDAGIERYLDFPLPESYVVSPTLRHLMTHSAGFPERFHGVFDPDLSRSLGEVLQVNFPDPAYPPGTTMAYSNFGAGLAGYIVQRVQGKDWEALVQERIFAPLGMVQSTVAQPVPTALEPFLASTYAFGDPEPGRFRVTPLAPMGSLTATPADMGRLLAMLLARGAAPGGRILEATSVEEMLRLQRPLAPGLPDGLGLGLLVGEYRGIRYAGHAGNMSTLATDLELLPDHGLGWYYVLNSQGPGEAARQLRERLLHAAIDRFLPGPAASPPATATSTAAEVAGRYVSTRRLRSGPLMFSGLVDTTSVVEEQGGGLLIETSGRVSRWAAAGADRFVERNSGIALVATRDGAGRVRRIASAALYPVAEFERAPLLTVLVPPLALFAGATFLAALLAAPFVAWCRRRRRAAGGGAEPGTRLLAWSRRAAWLLGLCLLSWVAFALALAIDFGILFTAPAAIRLLLALLSLLSAPLAVLVVAGAVVRWRNGGSGWASRTGSALLAAAALAAAFLLHALDLTNPGSQW